jgi:electron transport complex protein RnfC
MVIERAKGTVATRVVSVETALAALDAVREGKVQSSKLVTYISPAGEGRANLRVPMGTRFRDLFQKQGLAPRDQDKVIAGGPLRGFTQYSLDVSVDQGVDAFMLMPREVIEHWTNEPCVNCGACIKVCPVKLQPGLLGKSAEFGLFDQAEDYQIDKCIECGLCAAVCTGRRPILQWIRTAKEEIAKKRAAQQASETEKCETEEQQ